ETKLRHPRMLPRTAPLGAASTRDGGATPLLDQAHRSSFRSHSSASRALSRPLCPSAKTTTNTRGDSAGAHPANQPSSVSPSDLKRSFDIRECFPAQLLWEPHPPETAAPRLSSTRLIARRFAATRAPAARCRDRCAPRPRPPPTPAAIRPAPTRQTSRARCPPPI